MTESSPFPRRSLSRLCAALLLVLLGAASGPSLQAQTCNRSGCGRLSDTCGGSPAKPAPDTRWTDLQPTDTVKLPGNRDTTAFDQATQIFDFFSFFMSVDVEDGYLLGAIAHGIQIWDVRGSNQTSPVLVSQYKGGFAGSFNWPIWVNDPHIFYPLYDIDAPTGKNNVAAMAGEGGIGLAIFDLSDKTTPKLTYQNHKKDMRQVYAATIGGADYAFGAAYQGEPAGGLYVYNMTAAMQYTHCAEGWPAAGEAIACPGVYVGRFGTLTNVYYVDGVDNFVVTSSGASRGFEIHDFSSPASPVQKLKGLTNASVYGVALWRDGSSYYLGAIGDSALNIYDVSCIASACTGLGGPIATVPMTLSTREQLLTFSRSGSTPYLYVGSDDNCRSGSPQREFLFDVSNPASPRSLGGASYFDWYYRGSATGFNRVAPRTAKFNGDYLYRAGLSILDIHKLIAARPPSADFTFAPAGGGTEIYPDMDVNFTDKSSGSPNIWNWTFPGGEPSSASTKNPTTKFNPTGPFPVTVQVTLQATNSSGSSTPITKPLQILDPNPQIQSVNVSPPSPYVCQPITFAAVGATGRPALTYGWTITRDGVTAPVKTGGGSPFTWSDTNTATPGSHTASVEVTNGLGQKTTKQAVFTLNALPTLPAGGGFAPTCTNCTAGSPPSGTVNLEVNVPGATEWCWDFGDGTTFPTGCVSGGGTVFGAFSNDPVNGPKATHVYTTVGSKAIKVYVRNCVEAARAGSLSVNITQTEPLTSSFRALGVTCNGLGCFGASTNQPVTFEDNSTGAESWEFDWNGNGFGGADDQTVTASAFTVVDGKRQIKHTYTTASTYLPQLRVRRGAEVSDAFVHRPISVGGGGGGTPKISVSGPPTGKVNTAQTFSASATNCTADASGWTWDVSGGTIAGGSSGGSISVSWSSTGVKSVQAGNSGCTGVQGSASISITNDDQGGGGGPLAASFTWTPPAPKAGEAVSFNGSSSTGSPEGYEWNFGDGTPNASGSITSHTFAAAGTYNVRLSVRKQGSGPGCLFNVCIAETIKQVTVITSAPPLNPAYTVDAAATCENQFGFEICRTTTGKTVTLTAVEADATYAWDFGDGQTGSGRSVTHTWNNPKAYGVLLTVTKGGVSASSQKNFNVSGNVTGGKKAVVLPWIAQSRGPLVQSSDLYLHNPSSTDMEVTLEFRQRGLSEASPPKVKRTIVAGATLFVADVLRDLFDRENYTGFVNITLETGNVEPIITSFNTTFANDGSEFGQTVPGVSMSSTSAATSGSAMQYLIGLNDNSERVAYFGVTNPTDQPATYRLKFFDSDGKPVGKGDYQLTLSRFGQKQYQPKDLRELFGVHDIDDFRVQIETTAGGHLFPYGASIRVGSEDPSYIGTGTQSDAKVYLLGALATKGLNESLWQTDLVISNTTTEVILTELTFTGTGVTAEPTTPVKLTLQPGETRRLANVLEQWGLTKAVGVLTLDSDAPGGVFPLVQGESYENTLPTRRFGQSMPALTVRQAAGPNQGQYLVGLRQNDKNRTTLWIFNPGDTAGDYDVIYRGLDGKELGRIATKLGPGKLRQISPNQHPLPKAGVDGGFTIQVVVKAGKVLAAAQVINNVTNDPAYIQGETR